jgi:hypothetical protein
MSSYDKWIKALRVEHKRSSEELGRIDAPESGSAEEKIMHLEHVYNYALHQLALILSDELSAEAIRRRVIEKTEGAGSRKELSIESRTSIVFVNDETRRVYEAIVRDAKLYFLLQRFPQREAVTEMIERMYQNQVVFLGIGVLQELLDLSLSRVDFRQVADAITNFRRKA